MITLKHFSGKFELTSTAIFCGSMLFLVRFSIMRAFLTHGNEEASSIASVPVLHKAWHEPDVLHLLNSLSLE